MTPEDIRLKFALRNPSVIGQLQFLSDSHLHPDLKAIVTPIREAAFALVDMTKDGPELTVGLRELVKAKDTFCRHFLSVNNFKLSDVSRVQ